MKYGIFYQFRYYLIVCKNTEILFLIGSSIFHSIIAQIGKIAKGKKAGHGGTADF